MAKTLREFLISTGWDFDRTKRDQAHFEVAIESAVLKATLLAEVIIGIAKGMADAVKDATVRFDQLFFAAQRLNTTAAFANDFPVLIAKYGGNSAEAKSLLETAAAELYKNSGNITILNKLGFGLDTTTGKLGIQKEMLENLRAMSIQEIYAKAELLGLPVQPLLLMKRHLDEVLPDLKAYEDYRNGLKFDIEKASVDGKNFETALRSVGTKLGAIGDKIWDGLELAFTPFLKELDVFLTKNAKAIGEAIQIVVDALVLMFAAWTADFETILNNPNSTKDFADSIATLAKAIEWIAKKMERLVVALTALYGVKDILNYLAGGTGESADAGKKMVEDTGKLLTDPKTQGNPYGDLTKGWETIKSGAAKAKDWVADKLGFGAAAAEAPGGLAGSGSPSATGGAFAIGDSLAFGVQGALGSPGSARVGAGSDEILGKINSLTSAQLANRTVILSGGASNSHDPAALTALINALKGKGVTTNNIRVLGVGTRSDFAGYNEKLRAIAEGAGASFVPIVNPGEVHPLRGYTGTAAAAMAVRLPAPVAPPPPQAKPSPYGELAPFTAPPVSPGAWRAPPTSGGDQSNLMLNAPSQTVIHVDGTGDPTAVAHLVHNAQKSVNAHLGETLEQATP